ncbi:MAG: flippase [Patescibacteria group bacterium]|nr:flippase [Patescibacteria group bacterium]
MNFKIKVAFNTIVQLLGRIFSGLVTYLITLILARAYGPTGFGDFIKIITYVSYFYIMADFGANAIAVKVITEEKDSREILSSLLGFRLLASLILIFISLAVLSFLPIGNGQGYTPLVRLGIIVLSVTILTQSILTTANASFQKDLRYDKSVLATAFGYLLTLLLAYLFSLGHLSLVFIALSYAAGGLLTVLICYLLLPQKILPSFNPEKLRYIFFTSLPLGVTLVLNVIYFKADSFILTLTRSTQEVGVYGLAYKFFELSLVFPTFFMNSLYPVFLEKKQDKSGFKSILKQSGIILVVGAVLLTLVMLLFAPLLINFTSGAKYLTDFSGAVLALRILSLSLPLFFVSSFLMWLLITHNKQNLLVPFYGFSMLVNIVLNIMFIPKYGYVPAAITTGVSEAVVTVLLLIPSIRLLKKNNGQ